MLRELADMIERPLSKKSLWLREVPEDWKKANATPIFKKFKKEPGELQAVSFHSVP